MLRQPAIVILRPVLVIFVVLVASCLWSQNSQPPPPAPGQIDRMQQQEADTATPHQSARSFEGRIAKAGDQYVLEDKAAQTSYKLDDQQKAKNYLGKNVKVMATMDSRSHILRVIDIVPAPPEDEEK